METQESRNFHDARHVVISSNRWFSAVTEYALQFSLFLHMSGRDVQVVGHELGPFVERARQRGLSSKGLWLRTSGFLESLRSLFSLLKFLRNLRQQELMVLWLACGHEHLVCGIFRFFSKRLRRTTVLARLRCQDKQRHGWGPISAVLRRMTRLEVYPSHMALERHRKVSNWFPRKSQTLLSQLDLSAPRYVVQPFCKTFLELPEAALACPQSRHSPWFGVEPPQLPADAIVFATIARFDPVKGLEELIRAFVRTYSKVSASAELKKPLALVIVGRPENLSTENLIDQARTSCVEHLKTEPQVVGTEVSACDGRLRLVIRDEQVEGLADLLRGIDCAVISSQGSETVCRTVVEYLQCAVPIVATPVGSLVEAIGRAAGVFSEGTQELQLAAALEEALQVLADPDQSRRVKHNAWERGQQLQLKGYESLLRGLVG